MSTTTRITAAVSLALTAIFGVSTAAHADPLPGEVLKFQQQPLNNLNLPSTVVPTPPAFQGHDNVSTAYEYTNSQGLTAWQGGFMADDFADKLSSPVVHLKWWGSYMNNNYNGLNGAGVQKFMIAFESDVPAQNGAVSHPGTVLSSQIVTAGALTPGSGTFQEKLINGNAPEHLYQYNAELNLGQEFQEQKDTVYWLKIVALTNDQNLSWGWHNRDYTLQDTFASGLVSPGESVVGQVGPAAFPTNVWHFQDDAVRGAVDISPVPGTTLLNVLQPVASMGPTNYLDNIDGPSSSLSSAGIGNYSQDMAFELYTVPEPSSAAAIALGAIGLLARRRRR